MDLTKIIEQLLYLPLEIENPPADFLDHLDSIPDSKLYPDEYRNCHHVPLMYDFKPGNFSWTPYAFKYTKLREWFEDVLFPITGKSRVMIITTRSNATNPPHIDCSKNLFNTTLQHKFRYVLQGNIHDLEFMDNSSNSVSPSLQAPDRPFVMSGSWPHYMQNKHTGRKYTLALGAPWDGSLDNNTYRKLIEVSYNKYKDFYLSKDNLVLPSNWETLFEEDNNFREKAKEFLHH